MKGNSYPCAFKFCTINVKTIPKRNAKILHIKLETRFAFMFSLKEFIGLFCMIILQYGTDSVIVLGNNVKPTTAI